MAPVDRRPRRRPAAKGAADYLPVNLRSWDRTARAYERRHERTLRRQGGKAWGTSRVPERRLRLLDPVRGARVLELGCGAADWSIALRAGGARAVGLDFSRVRLVQALERSRTARVPLPLVRARAERLPFRDSAFDIVLSDYGATTFTDPARTVPEVARVLRSGGSFVFAHASPFRTVSENLRTDRLERRLRRSYFGLRRTSTPDWVEFQLPYGEWIRLFASCDLVVERLVEPAAPRTPRSSYLSAPDQRWAQRWPYDALWKVRKVLRRPPRPRAAKRDGRRRRAGPP